MQKQLIERPIIFSTEMVQAIMEGRKTMTRRIVKPQPKNGMAFYKLQDNFALFYDQFVFEVNDGVGAYQTIKVPYGQPGDLLWVRETWCIDSRGANGDDPGYYYKSKMPVFKDDPQIWPSSWKSPMYMPKAAARIWLEITDVMVERLKDITQEDAIAEGIEIDSEILMGNLYKDYFQKKYRDVYANPQNSFKSLWRHINGAESWDANPWVWVISFKVLSTTGKP